MCVPLITVRVTIPRWHQATYVRLDEVRCNRTNVLCFAPESILHLCIVFHRKTSSSIMGIFSHHMVIVSHAWCANTALCVTRRLPFNFKFVVNVTALVHRNWNDTNLHCICHISGGEKGLFIRVPDQDELWHAKEKTTTLTISANCVAAEWNNSIWEVSLAFYMISYGIKEAD